MTDEQGQSGRPEHKPTRPSRDKVMLRAACNWSRQEIAMEMGISVPTLAKHYHTELETGWIKMRGQALDMLKKSAKGGNVSAQGKLVALIDQSNPNWTPNSGTNANPTGKGAEENKGAEASEPLGKKGQQAEAAKTAGIGTDWGTDLVPGSKAN